MPFFAYRGAEHHKRNPLYIPGSGTGYIHVEKIRGDMRVNAADLAIKQAFLYKGEPFPGHDKYNLIDNVSGQDFRDIL